MEKPVVNKQNVPQVHEELFVRVNDVLESVNRIGRRYDTAHAQIVLTHAFARYGAFHYKSTVKNDTAEERAAYVQHLADAVKTLLEGHMRDIVGEVPAAPGEAGKH